MKRNKFALQILVSGLIAVSFIACDKDFANLESDIINTDNATNFDILSLTDTKPEFTEVIAYTQALGPVQTNGLGLNTLGIYDDLYGRTTSSFVTQVTAANFDPDFGDEVVIDSVVLKIPYFSVATEVEDDGNILYEIDSVIGRKDLKIRLFESNYFIRDFDPNGEFDDNQSYFSNKMASDSEDISDAVLEGNELNFVDYNDVTGEYDPIDNIININDEGYILTEPDNDEDDDDDPQVLLREPPGLRIMLDTTYWHNKIIAKEGEPELSSASNFAEYFRGLYFKAETVNNEGSFLILNTGAQTSHVTIYYTRLTESTTDDADETEQATFQIRFGPSRINFMDNNYTTPISDGDAITGDSRIYLKGGEGSLGKIKLFNGDDIDDSNDDMTFDDWKEFFVETENGKFVKSRRLVNEANLVFYVDEDAVETPSIEQDNEPNRIYLYDIENKTPLTDYYLDNSLASLPSFSIINHLGPLQRVGDESDGNGIKYKLKITEHINNLLLRDSTNVELGLSVSINVNLEELLIQREVLSNANSGITSPTSSVITPRGTVLHGNTTEDGSKKVYLEIYYTEPEN
jgi:hypothetical protein